MSEYPDWCRAYRRDEQMVVELAGNPVLITVDGQHVEVKYGRYESLDFGPDHDDTVEGLLVDLREGRPPRAMLHSDLYATDEQSLRILLGALVQMGVRLLGLAEPGGELLLHQRIARLESVLRLP